MIDRKCVFWNREEPLDERGREMWARATTLFNLYGQERYSALDAALTVYYGNARHSLAGANFTGDMVLALLGVSAENTEPPGQNVIQMVVDTMVGHTVHDKVRPFYLTEKGDADARDQAQAMMRATEGILTSEGMYGELAVAIAKLGFIADGGFVKWIPDYARNKVTAKLLLPHEWLVEKGERVGFEYELVDRWMLLEDFGFKRGEDGEKAKTESYDKILHAPAASIEAMGERSNKPGETNDKVLVITGYHRPSGYVDLDDETSFGLNDDGEVDNEIDPLHDGVRMVMIDGHVLHHEPWAYDELPVCEFFPSKDPIGYGSRGVPETLAGAQLAINRHNRRIEDSLAAHARNLLIVWRNAKINVNKITNGVATILTSNVPPSQALYHVQPNPVPEALVNRVDRVTQWALQQYGMNLTSLAGEKPPGVDHAPGMEHLAEELTLRHTEQSDAWKRLYMKSFRRIIECCRMLALRDPNFEVYFEDDKVLERIVWRKVELERQKFSAKCWPTNLLAKTPAAKLRRLTELKALGAVTDQQIQSALVDEYPDLAALTGDAAAAERNLRKKIDQIAKNGFSLEYAPHPYVLFPLAKALAVEAINRLEEEGNDEGMDRVIEFWEAVHDLELSEKAKAVAAEQGLPPGGPPAPPGMPPNPALPPGGAQPMPAPGGAPTAMPGMA